MDKKTIYYYLSDGVTQEKEEINKVIQEIAKDFEIEFVNIQKDKAAKIELSKLEPLASGFSRILMVVFFALPIVVSLILAMFFSDSFIEARYAQYNEATNKIDIENSSIQEQLRIIKQEFNKYQYLTTKEDIDTYIEEQIKMRNSLARKY